MTSGGARNKSGPAKDPGSRTSERAGFSLLALPAEGNKGRAPAFPMPKITRYTGDGPNARLTATFRKREIEIWRESWKTPQACAWLRESWRWPTIAEFCRLKTVVEMSPDANAALVAQLHRFRDQIGLTPAGLRENGWAIAADQVGAKRESTAAKKKTAAAPPPRRLRSVPAK